MGHKRRTTTTSSRNSSSTFDPKDAERVEHHRIGVWDLYVQHEEKLLSYVPSAWRDRLEEYGSILNDMPYLWRTVKDISKTCWHFLVVYATITVIIALLPALTLWYSGQLLKIVQIAVEDRTVDKNLLFRIAGGRVLCTLSQRLLEQVRTRVSQDLNSRIKQHYSVHIFHSMARLDVPTYEDPVVARQLDAIIPSERSSIAWTAISSLLRIVSSILQVGSQFLVLYGVLSEQRDGPLLALLSLADRIVSWFDSPAGPLQVTGVWAATVSNEDFLRMEGMKRVITNPRHRQELVAGSMTEHLTKQYRKLVTRLGDRAGDFWSLHHRWVTNRRSTVIKSILREPLSELPQIVFTLRAAQYPTSIPVSLASLHLIQQSSQSFMFMMTSLTHQAGTLSEKMSGLRKLYEAANIPNKVPDGRIPFPENAQSIHNGISLEFRHVSFKYTGSDDYALRDISFKIAPGQLCVIVGVNGSGKSTILKLIARIYDVTEGEILLDGRDIRTLQLHDIRRAMAILFQDYTHFPLTVRENIALGDPDSAHDDACVREAARLGGAEELIGRLPDGFDTYLERPVRDLYSGLPEGTTTLFGRSVSYRAVRGAMGRRAAAREQGNVSLSGGQMQRLAVASARTFMRSMSSEQKVGLLLFDEPSASLDPTAEHDLFGRLRELRGSKTMVFSTHRFGNLTRHADVILYMDDSRIVEAGTHEGLLKRDGEYSRLWRLQAQAFL